jgi:cell division protein FtsW (lipid II flippase)
MDFILNILVALGLVPAKDLSDSMGQSSTLTIMVIVGIVLFGIFILFLFKMAGAQ